MGDTKNDLNRVGLFSELGYITVGDPYDKKNAGKFNDSAHKGKQMLPGGSKSRNATQAGYFDKSFARIMTGEGYSDPVKRRRQDRMEKTKKNLSQQPFVPSHAGKEPSGLGSHYGTFSGPIPEFSPVEKTSKPYVSPGKNMLVNPAKKGTGYGYVNVFIGKLPKNSPEPYDAGRELRKNEHDRSKDMMKGDAFKLNLHPKTYFDGNPYKTDKPLPPFKDTKKESTPVKPFQPSSPGKEIGGGKAGCFTRYPAHSEEPYNPPKRTFREYSKEKHIFKPPQIPKSRPTKSIMIQNIDRKINVSNYKVASLATVSV